MRETFELKKGTVVTVPDPTTMVVHTACKTELDPEKEPEGALPCVARLSCAGNGMYRFAYSEECANGVSPRRRRSMRDEGRTKVCFMPQPEQGLQLRITAVDSNSIALRPLV
jgi:hypothetical protein